MICFAPASAADMPALVALQTRTFDDDSRRFRNQPSGGPPGYDSLDWNLKIGGMGRYFKILLDETLVGGFVVFDLGHDHYELGRIYVDPAFQDRHIGAQAMAFIETAFPQATRWTLDTPVWATRNHHFYEQCGYRRVRVVDDMVYYEKRLMREEEADVEG